MPELQTLTHGETFWDTKVNAAIKRLNEVGGGNRLSLVEKGAEGIVALNGTALNDTHYDVVPLIGCSIVTLYYSVKNDAIPDAGLYAVDLMQLPDNIKPIGNHYGIQAFGLGPNIADQAIYVTMGYEGRLNVSAPFKITKALGFRGTFTYLTKGTQD